MIELRDVHKTYHMGDTLVQALRGVSLTVEPGEFIAIIGPSGSGKSTLMHIIGLLDVPDSGSYRLRGREIAKLADDQLAMLRRQQVGFVFQQFHLLARTSAAENVSLPLLYSQGRYDLDAARGLLARVGLADRCEHRPNQLSGGQQQRVAIARSLVNHPHVLLADEPTGNLDSASQREILEILQDLNRQGITVIIVTHEEEIARQAARRIHMRDGAVQSDQHEHTSRISERNPPLPSGEGWGEGSLRWQRSQTSHPSSPSLLPEGEGGEPMRAPRRAFRIIEHVRQGLRALAANKARTALSMLGILIGVAAVVAVLALGQGAQDAIQRQITSLGTNLLTLFPGTLRVGGVTQVGATRIRLTFEDVAAIKERVPGVVQAGPAVSGRARITFGNKNWDTSVNGFSTAQSTMRNASLFVGRSFTDEEDRQRALVVVLGATVARELFGTENPVGQTVKINRTNARVIGVMPERGATSMRDLDDIVVVPVQTAMRRLLGKEFIDWIDIQAESTEAIESVKTAAVELMISRHRVPASQGSDAFRVRSMQELMATMEQSSRTMTYLLSSIAAISLLVGGIGIMNIMLVSVTERTREIGLRKAVGARRSDIQIQFLIETVVVSVAGGVAGILFGWLVTSALAYAVGWTTSVTLWSVALAFTFSAAIGLVFGIYPARRAAALNPIEALRYE